MKHYEVLPKDFDAILSLPRGCLWLYSNSGASGPSPEYKVYSVDPEIWPQLKKLDGVKRAAVYETSRFRLKAMDFIVQSFATKTVLRLLGWDGSSQIAIEF